jgi:hypothetical protein
MEGVTERIVVKTHPNIENKEGTVKVITRTNPFDLLFIQVLVEIEW